MAPVAKGHLAWKRGSVSTQTMCFPVADGTYKPSTSAHGHQRYIVVAHWLAEGDLQAPPVKNMRQKATSFTEPSVSMLDDSVKAVAFVAPSG